MEDWFSAPGFECHPHRGIEMVAMVLDGVLEHADNAGDAGALLPGDVQSPLTRDQGAPSSTIRTSNGMID